MNDVCKRRSVGAARTLGSWAFCLGAEFDFTA